MPLFLFDLPLLDQVLHANHAVLLTPHLLKQCLDRLINVIILVTHELLALVFDLLVSVHLREQVVEFRVFLLLFERDQVLEVLNLLAFKSLVKVLARLEKLIQLLNLVVAKVKVGWLAEDFRQVVVEEPEVACILLSRAIEGVVLFHCFEDLYEAG